MQGGCCACGGRPGGQAQANVGRAPADGSRIAPIVHVRAGEDGGIRDGGVVKEVAIRAVLGV